ncbi:MAG: SDR family oxidoreductase [Planctomycetota bacterium]|jgi:3-oxoacyl-[acyl-carrier protein] reductase
MTDNEKIAIVTGAGRGIGLEIARKLLSLGMTVVAVDLKDDLLSELPGKLDSPGEKLLCKSLDVSDSEGFTKLVDDLAEQFGHVDVLVNNAQRGGSIINMASYSGVEGNRGQANYSASKAGLIGLTKTTAKELASKSIRCNAVAPGFIATEMTEAMPQQAKDIALSLIPLKRMGLPEDIANAVGFLASEASNYVTGQVLSVDGGMHT